MVRNKQLILAALLGLASLAWSQTPASTATSLSMSSQAVAEVENDEMTVLLSVRKEGQNTQEISQYVLSRAQRGIAAAKRVEAVTARLSNTNTSPVWTNKGRQEKIWLAYASLVLTSHNFPALSKLAAELTEDMQIERVTFALSRSERLKTEDKLMLELATSFRDKANAATKAFGFKSYEIKSLNLAQNMGGIAQPYPMGFARASAASSADNSLVAVPTEGGKTSVSLSVNGVLEMLR